MYSITVDDTAQAGHRALATALQVLSQGEALPSLNALGPAGTAPAMQAQPIQTDSLGDSIHALTQPGCNQKVHLQLVCQVGM